MVLAAQEDHVEHGLGARPAGRAEQVDHGLGLQARHHQVAADVEDLGLADPIGRDVLDGEAVVGPGRADEPAVLALDVDDHRRGRADAGDAVDARGYRRRRPRACRR